MAIAVIGRLVGPQFSAGDKAARLNKLWMANLVLTLVVTTKDSESLRHPLCY